MIADAIARLIRLPNEWRVSCGEASNTEKSGMDVILLKQSEYLRGVVRIWPIIEGERNFWQVGIPAIKQTILRLKCGNGL